MLYLVRHGHAGTKHAWQGTDELRPLSPRGRLQAEGLVRLLAPYAVRRILSSPTERCRQTVTPLARVRGLRVTDEPRLGVGVDLDRVLAWLGDRGLEGAVACTHGEVIGAVLERLAAQGVRFGPERRWPKGSVWVLDSLGGQVARARYLAPVPVPD
jgi:broad specificity phosphatase PhoE